MNPEPDNAETDAAISGYFDEALSAAECGELALLLRTDPSAALEFARTARVHALLEATAPARPAGRAVVRRRRWLMIGAAAAVIAAGSLAVGYYFGRSPDPSPDPHIVIQDGSDFHIERKPLPPGVNLRTVRAPAAAAPVALDHLLVNFTVHADPNGLTVPEALRALERAIGAANVLNRRELAALRFTAGRVVMPAELGPEGTQVRQKVIQSSVKMKELVDQWEAAARSLPSGKSEGAPRSERNVVFEPESKQEEADRLAGEIKALEREMDELRRERLREDQRQSDPENPRINAPLPGPYTIKEYLDICSLYCEIRQEPGGVVYGVPVVGGSADDAPSGTTVLKETKAFRVPPDLLTWWFPRAKNARDPGMLENIQHEVLTIARSALSPGLYAGPPAFPPVNSLKYSRSDSTITVTASRPALERWQQILNVCSQRKTVQHYIITKYVICPAELLPPGFDPNTGMILDDQEFQIFCRAISQASGVELIQAPSIIVIRGLRSAIQVMYEVPNSPPVEPNASDWLGLQEELATTSVGETILASGMVDLGLPAQSGLKALRKLLDTDRPPGTGNPAHPYLAEGARHHRTGFDIWIPSGCTAMFTLDVNTGDSRTVLACITAQALDAAGIPIWQER